MFDINKALKIEIHIAWTSLSLRKRVGGLKMLDFCPKGGFIKLGDLGGTFADLVTILFTNCHYISSLKQGNLIYNN